MKVKSFQHRSKLSEADFSGLLHSYLSACIKANKGNNPEPLDHFFRVRLQSRQDRAELNVFLNRLLQATGGKVIRENLEPVAEEKAPARPRSNSDQYVERLFLAKLNELSTSSCEEETWVKIMSTIACASRIVGIPVGADENHDCAIPHLLFLKKNWDQVLSGETPFELRAEAYIHLGYLLLEAMCPSLDEVGINPYAPDESRARLAEFSVKAESTVADTPRETLSDRLMKTLLG